MENKEVISMSLRELKRLHVIQKVIERRIKQRKAAELLGLSIRQIKRLVKRVRREKEKGIIHQLRGRESNRKHPEELKKRVLGIYEIQYPDFGPTLAQEKLSERNKIHIGRETLRQWLIEKGLWEMQRKGRTHREWRERKECFGEMTQVDGSHHDWLEGRGPELVLMGYIDDATSNVFARFYDYEGTMPAMDSFYRYSKQYGLPHAIYIDRLNAYRGHGKLSLEEELAGKTHKKSQFERALEELGVDVIHAQSPQAKGRIERLFRTFQDRLIKEMRLAGVKSREEANQFLETYLPKYNRRFSVKACDEANLYRQTPRDQELRRILSIQTKHVLRNDNTIRHDNKFYQILTRWNGRRPKHVVLEDRLDGKRYLADQSKALRYREIKVPSPKTVLKPEKPLFKTPRKVSPPLDHPWRKLCLPETSRKPALRQDFSRLNAFGQAISTKDNLQHHPNSTYQQHEQFQQKEERTKEEKELLLIHS